MADLTIYLKSGARLDLKFEMFDAVYEDGRITKVTWDHGDDVSKRLLYLDLDEIVAIEGVDDA